MTSRPRSLSQSAAQRGWALAWVALLAPAACGQPKAGSGGPPAQCTKEYAQCALKPGVLGVCNAVECTADRQPPCFVCRSQH